MRTKHAKCFMIFLSFALVSCGKYVANLPKSDVCLMAESDFGDPLLSNSFINLKNDLCQPKNISNSNQLKKIQQRESGASVELKANADAGLDIQSVKPRDQVSPIVLKQATVPSKMDRLNFNPEQLKPEQIDLLRPLIAEIMQDYGHPQSDLGKIRALRDWVARTIIHPYSFFHIFSPNKNVENLPIGKNWDDFYEFANNQKIYDDFIFLWSNFKLDGFKLLDYAIDLTGGNENGLMEKVSGSHYRLRSLDDTTYYQCTPQAMILIALANAMGYQGLLISTIGHDTSAIYVPSLSKWIYEDATYNEDYIDSQTGLILSPDELLEKSFEGNVFDSAIAIKNPGPSWDNTVFLDFSDSISTTYFNEHPMGMVAMGSQLNADMIDNSLYDTRLSQIMTPMLPSIYPFNDERVYNRVLPQRSFPELGLYLDGYEEKENNEFLVSIKSNINVFDLQIREESAEWKDIPDWQSGDSVSLPGNGKLVYLRARTSDDLHTSTMVIQMP